MVMANSRSVKKSIFRFSPAELLFIVVIAAITRLIAFAFLPNSPSMFGPDEGTYANLASWVAEGREVSSFPSFGAGLYNSSRSLILPSALFVKLGIDPLVSVRFTSLVYGVLSVYLFGKLLYELSKETTSPNLNYGRRLSLFLTIIFAFLPSVFLWSVIGLRESASSFWILASTYTLISLIKQKWSLRTLANFKEFLIQASLCVFAIIFSFGARLETTLVFLAFFCTSLMILKQGHRLIIFVVCLFSIAGGYFYTFTPSEPVTSETVLRADTVSELSSEAIVSLINLLNQKSNLNTLDAATALPRNTCSEIYNSISSLLRCNAQEIPYRLFSVLLRPLPVFDNGSTVNNLASLENVLWLVLISMFMFATASLLKKKDDFFLVIPTIMYVVGFVTLMVLSEGNLGTAFRHKSTILWPILLIIFISTRRNSRQHIHKGVKS
jgi:hypothetical protein